MNILAGIAEREDRLEETAPLRNQYGSMMRDWLDDEDETEAEEDDDVEEDPLDKQEELEEGENPPSGDVSDPLTEARSAGKKRSTEVACIDLTVPFKKRLLSKFQASK